MQIDHATIAGPDLAALQDSFAQFGLATEYGGAHSSGLTHMALLGFDDGSYLELISTRQPGQSAPRWGAHIAGAGGPCAWAVGADDIAAEAARIAALGVSVTGPVPLQRQRPDGVLIEWELAYLGEGEPGATLPFLIHDRTPREWRVRPSASVSGSELVGIATVVLGVRDLERASDLFRRVYAWPAPTLEPQPSFGATLASFPGTPVALAATTEQDGWLAERLARFGESPCALLIGTTDLAASSGHLPLVDTQSWFGRQVAWIDPARLHGARLGLVAVA